MVQHSIPSTTEIEVTNCKCTVRFAYDCSLGCRGKNLPSTEATLFYDSQQSPPPLLVLLTSVSAFVLSHATHSATLSLSLSFWTPSKAQTTEQTQTLTLTRKINNGIWGRQFPQGSSQKLRCPCWVCFLLLFPSSFSIKSHLLLNVLLFSLSFQLINMLSIFASIAGLSLVLFILCKCNLNLPRFLTYTMCFCWMFHLHLFHCPVRGQIIVTDLFFIDVGFRVVLQICFN